MTAVGVGKVFFAMLFPNGSSLGKGQVVAVDLVQEGGLFLNL